MVVHLGCAPALFVHGVLAVGSVVALAGAVWSGLLRRAPRPDGTARGDVAVAGP